MLLLLGLSIPAFAPADVTITQLANEGVIVSSGDTRIMVDGMVVEPYSVYGGLPEEVVPQFRGASGDFSSIDLALASHRHHDHNQPEFACVFMQASESTLMKSSGQVMDLMREKCRSFMTTSSRVQVIDPQYDLPEIIELPGARVTVFPLSHGTRSYALLENYGHLIEIGGMTVLHIGDAAMDPQDFERAGLAGRKIDIALIPFWFFQPGPGAAVVSAYLDARLKIAVHIPPGEMQEVQDYMEENYPRVLILERPMEQARFIANASSSQ